MRSVELRLRYQLGISLDKSDRQRLFEKGGEKVGEEEGGEEEEDRPSFDQI